MRADPRGKAVTDVPSTWIPCAHRPVLVVASRDGTLLLDESGACHGLPLVQPSSLERIEELDGFAASVGKVAGGLVVSLFSEMVAWWKEGEGTCTFREVRSPVLALVDTPWGVVSGDAAGWVTFLEEANSFSPEITFGEPILGLSQKGPHTLALGRSGAVGRLDLSLETAHTFGRIEIPANFGRVFGLFTTGPSSNFGLFGADRVSLIDPLERFTLAFHTSRLVGTSPGCSPR